MITVPSHFNFFNFPTCQSCQCNSQGSVSLQCTSDGRCNCKTGYNGKKCRECDLFASFFGFLMRKIRSSGRNTDILKLSYTSQVWNIQLSWRVSSPGLEEKLAESRINYCTIHLFRDIEKLLGDEADNETLELDERK